jgi:hypothetical protein
MVLLGDLSRHLEPLREEAKSIATSSSSSALIDLTAPKLEHCVSSLITYSHANPSHEHILTSDMLLHIFDLFKPSRRVEMSKDVIDAFAKRSAGDEDNTTNDPILINTLFDLARTLHDSLDRSTRSIFVNSKNHHANSLSPEGERRHIASLICGFIGKVSCATTNSSATRVSRQHH